MADGTRVQLALPADGALLCPIRQGFLAPTEGGHTKTHCSIHGGYLPFP